MQFSAHCSASFVQRDREDGDFGREKRTRSFQEYPRLKIRASFDGFRSCESRHICTRSATKRIAKNLAETEPSLDDEEFYPYFWLNFVYENSKIANTCYELL